MITGIVSDGIGNRPSQSITIAAKMRETKGQT